MLPAFIIVTRRTLCHAARFINQQKKCPGG